DGAWHELGADRIYTGGGRVEVEAPLETIPVFVRAGAVLPLDEHGARTLSLYPPSDGVASESTVYDDAGDGYGDSLAVRYELRRAGSRIELLRTASEGSYPPPETLKITLASGPEPTRAIVDGRVAPLDGSTATVPGDFERLELTTA